MQSIEWHGFYDPTLFKLVDEGWLKMSMVTNQTVVEYLIEAICKQDQENKHLKVEEEILSKIASIRNSIEVQVRTFYQFGYIKKADLPEYFETMKNHGMDTLQLELFAEKNDFSATDIDLNVEAEDHPMMYPLFVKMLGVLKTFQTYLQEFKDTPVGPLIIQAPLSSIYLGCAYEICMKLKDYYRSSRVPYDFNLELFKQKISSFMVKAVPYSDLEIYKIISAKNFEQDLVRWINSRSIN